LEYFFRISVIDQRLPGMDGDDFIRRAMRLNRDMAYVIFSGSIEYELPADLMACDCVSNQVFIKPLADLEPLEQAITNLLGKIRKHNVVEEQHESAEPG